MQARIKLAHTKTHATKQSRSSMWRRREKCMMKSEKDMKILGFNLNPEEKDRMLEGRNRKIAFKEDKV